MALWLPGAAPITDVAQGFMTAFPDMELQMDDVRIEGDRAVYHWTFIGTNNGPGELGIGFGSAASKSGGWERMDSLRSRRASSIAPTTNVKWNAAWRSPGWKAETRNQKLEIGK